MGRLRETTFENARYEYLISEFLKLTLQAGLASRGGRGIYAKGATAIERKNLKEEIREKLKELVGTYRDRSISTDEHEANIEMLADFLSTKHRKALRDNKFRIGIAQKLLNLFLKYLWVSEEMKEWHTKMPPHCPFDNKIVTRLRKLNPKLKNWTEIDKMSEYEQCIYAAQQACRVAGFETIAEWELVVYNESIENSR